MCSNILLMRQSIYFIRSKSMQLYACLMCNSLSFMYHNSEKMHPWRKLVLNVRKCMRCVSKYPVLKIMQIIQNTKSFII